ncbi:4Fe-4S single cluster domain-containing protein [Streptomyces sp. NPDC093252]|uniref:4Fe-4S single cluster domain-containing protein n=1 Tax=Streptomyces sp. NPDC093252 TaxID=3154980 RepID=UPI00343FF3BF
MTLNIAAWGHTRMLGPGLRAAVWVQGCPFDCRGCMAPEWIPDRPARLLDPVALAKALYTGPEVTGVTLSGGEPMRQAGGLAALLRALQDLAGVHGSEAPDVICFTGHTLASLRARPPNPRVPELLGLVDVLIDGQYVAQLDDGRGLRGSSNQTVHHLTERLRAADEALTTGPRRAQLDVVGGELHVIGVPPPHLPAAARLPLHPGRAPSGAMLAEAPGPVPGPTSAGPPRRALGSTRTPASRRPEPEESA